MSCQWWRSQWGSPLPAQGAAPAGGVKLAFPHRCLPVNELPIYENLPSHHSIYLHDTSPTSSLISDLGLPGGCCLRKKTPEEEVLLREMWASALEPHDMFIVATVVAQCSVTQYRGTSTSIPPAIGRNQDRS